MRPELVKGCKPARAGVDQTKGSYGLMARLIGVDLPRDKRLEIALTYIYGIGKTRALQTLEATQISGDLRVHQLTDEHLVALRDWIEANYQIEGDLRREVASDIRRKVEIGSYQGRRHRSGLPVRGQRTRTNARSRKGAANPSPARRRPSNATRRSGKRSRRI